MGGTVIHSGPAHAEEHPTLLGTDCSIYGVFVGLVLPDRGTATGQEFR